MPVKKQSLKSQLSECVQNYNEAGIDKLAKQIAKTGTIADKKLVAEAYSLMEVYIYADLVEDKFKPEDRKGVAEGLLDILRKVQKLRPDAVLFRERAECYSLLAKYYKKSEKKIEYQEKAVKEARRWLREKPASHENKHYLAEVLFERMKIKKDWSQKNFQEILDLFTASMKYLSPSRLAVYHSQSYWKNIVPFNSFIAVSYGILELPFNKKDYYHTLFLENFSVLAENKCAKSPQLFLTWWDQIMRLAEYYESYVKKSGFAKYIPKMREAASKQLLHLQNYETKDVGLLNGLGQAFQALAKITNKDDFDKKSSYLGYALKFFLAGQEINPMAWTFPVYATNVLKNIAELYHQKGNKKMVIKTFSKGKSIFKTTEKYLGDTFTLSNYCGEFLYEFADLGYDFKNERLLNDASKQFESAIKKGEGYYSEPYIYLAKIALRKSNKSRCLVILKECKEALSKSGCKYKFGEICEEKDFAEVCKEMRKMDSEVN